MNLIKAMPDANISVAKVITTTKNPEDAVAVISDDTFKFGISDLVSGTRAFLQYGKTDMLLDFWHKSGLENPEIEKLLYAMRNIDYGISLCDVTDIMRGIKSLRDVLKAVEEFKGETFVERFFEMIVSGIKQDYGSLVESDEIVFIDLVKWAYKKGFWQQTLTLIESRAPEDIVDKGFFYYSNSPANTQEVLKVFVQIYYDFKPFEKYKLDDISHYYVKFFGRGRVPHIDDSKAYQMAYGEMADKENESLPRIIENGLATAECHTDIVGLGYKLLKNKSLSAAKTVLTEYEYVMGKLTAKQQSASLSINDYHSTIVLSRKKQSFTTLTIIANDDVEKVRKSLKTYGFMTTDNSHFQQGKMSATLNVDSQGQVVLQMK